MEFFDPDSKVLFLTFCEWRRNSNFAFREKRSEFNQIVTYIIRFLTWLLRTDNQFSRIMNFNSPSMYYGPRRSHPVNRGCNLNSTSLKWEAVCAKLKQMKRLTNISTLNFLPRLISMSWMEPILKFGDIGLERTYQFLSIKLNSIFQGVRDFSLTLVE